MIELSVDLLIFLKQCLEKVKNLIMVWNNFGFTEAMLIILTLAVFGLYVGKRRKSKILFIILLNVNKYYCVLATISHPDFVTVSSAASSAVIGHGNNGQLQQVGFAPLANVPVANALPLANGGGHLNVLEQKRRAWAWARKEFPNLRFNYN